MNLDTLKSDYQNLGNESSKSFDSLNKMRDSGNHPVLKSIKRQLIIESILWTFVLIVFYDFFDGHLKLLFWNVLLGGSIILLLIHNVLGFLLISTPINGDSIKKSLINYLKKIKSYAIISVISRVLMITVFMFYLTSNINGWSTSKLWATIGFFTITVFIQIFLLNKVWKKRINKIEKQVDSFREI